MSTPISSSARALLDAAQQKFNSAEAKTDGTGRGWWPPDGNFENFVTDLTVEDAETEIPGGLKIACARIYWNYQLTPAGKVAAGCTPDEPGEWRGDSVSVYSDQDFAKLPAGWQTAAEISLDRLKGHFKTFLRLSDPELNVPLSTLVEAAKAKLAAGPVICVVQCQTRVQKKNIAPGATPKTYKSDYLYELCSG